MTRISITALVLCMALPLSAQTPPQRLFYSGHSLLDEPLPRDVAAIAASLGTPLQHWERDTPPGSSMKERVAAGAWPREAIDTLVVTEQHTLVGNLVWNDSAGQLLRLHERLIAANPRGRTWFYASWLNVDDKTDPRRWIAYERAASPVWQCLVDRSNASIAAQGRVDRIEFLPAAALLAALIERVTQGGVAGVGVASLMRDDVHLTPLGSYFMALVVHAALFERSPAGAAVPGGVDAATARVLQGVAWELLQQERARRQSLSQPACRERTQAFVATYAAYVRDVIYRPQLGPWRAWWLWAKHRVQWHWALRG